MGQHIHPTAIIDPSASLGSEVHVGPFAIIEAGVQIGDGSVIHHHAFIGRGARIGARCQVHHAAVVSNVPQDLKFRKEETFVELGDDSIVREFATIHRATTHDSDSNAGTHDGVTRLGRGCLIMAYAHVAHDCLLGDEVILSNAVQLAGHVTVESFSNISGGTLVHQFSLIGAYSMIGGGSQVRKDIPPYALVGGEPVRFNGINKIGLQRRGKSIEVIAEIKSAYTTIYSSGLNVSDALEQLSNDGSDRIPEIHHLIEFIKSSKRGIIGGP